MNEFTACGMYIFGGSQTIGHLQTGWKIDNILEMTEDMLENNSYHFIKNYPDIKVLKPSEWYSDSFLEDLKSKEIDLLFANNPCSGLSYINRNANVNQPINNRFFEVFDVINKIQPKVFLIENAPSLVSIGTPILTKMPSYLKYKYTFTIIHDYAGNHNVPMKRMRTLVIGWNKDCFNENVPLIQMNKSKSTTIYDVLQNIEGLPNCEFVNKRDYSNLEEFYDLVQPGESIIRMCCKNYDKVYSKLNKLQTSTITHAKNKLESGKNIWDKSPWRLKYDSKSPSLTSVSQFLHPVENRDFYIREYARLMGYPDDFIFYPDECKCGVIQCIAQGVPVNFIKYISSQIMNHLKSIGSHVKADIVYQNHVDEKAYLYNINEFEKIDNLHSSNDYFDCLTIND